MPDSWTTAQAALIIEKPLDVFEKVVERAPVKPKLRQRGGRQVRAFELRDLVFFCALDDLKLVLTAKMQSEIYDALMRAPQQDAIGHIEVGQLSYNFHRYFDLVQTKIAATAKLLDLVDGSGAEPLIKGTTISAYRIAALCDGMSIADILQDYPTLDDAQVLAARAYAEAHPKPGRPYPKVTAKQAMRGARAADADAFLPPRG